MQYCDYDFLMKHIICAYNYWDGPLSAYIKIDDKILFAYCIEESNDEDKGLDDYRTYKIIDLNWTEKCQEWLDDYERYYEHCFYTEDGKKKCFYDGRPLKGFTDKYNIWHPGKDYSL